MFECMRVSRPEICIPIFITVFVIGNLGKDLSIQILLTIEFTIPIVKIFGQ